MSGRSVQRLRVRGSFIACKLKHRQKSSSTPAADRSIGRRCCHQAAGLDDRSQETRDRRSPMNTALLVLRTIPGLLLMGHGLLNARYRRRRMPIPPDMTIERWRRLRRSTAPTQRDPWSRSLAAPRRVARHGESRCDHVHDTVSRYDHTAKRLELLLTCPICETEKVIHSLAYEPRFEPSVASVHALHPRDGAAVGRAHVPAHPPARRALPAHARDHLPRVRRRGVLVHVRLVRRGDG